MKKMIRQGDVLLIQCATLPVSAMPVKAKKNERVILAHGEVTGHHHSLMPGKAKLFSDDRTNDTGVHAGIVEVAEALAELQHQEHASIPLARGIHEVRRQREYHPEAIRRVAD